jgi:hypothetical protein
VDDYVRALIRQDQQAMRQKPSKKGKPRYQVDSAEELATKVGEAIASGDFREPTPEWWTSVLEDARKMPRRRGAK